MTDPRAGYPRRTGGHGRAIGIYADLPVKRECSCPDPTIYLDEDDDPVCFRCGQLVKGAREAA